MKPPSLAGPNHPETVISSISRSVNYVEKLMVVPPDGGWGWVIVAVSFLSAAIVDGVSVSFYLLRGHLTETLNIRQPQIALLGSFCNATLYYFGPVGCGLAQKFGFRCIMIVGSSIYSGAIIGCYFSKNYASFFILYSVIGGIGGGLVYVSYNIPPGFWFDKRRAIAVSIASCGSGLGNVVVPLLTEVVINSFHWKYAFLLHAGLLSVLLLLGTLLSPVPAIKVKIENIPVIRPIPQTTRKNTPPKITTRVQFTTSSLRLHSIILGRDEMIVQTKSQLLPRPAISGVESTVMYVTLKKPTHWWHRCSCCCHGNGSFIGGQPLLRRDVFYHGSLLRLQEYKTQSGHMEYQLSMSRMPYLLQRIEDMSQPEKKPFGTLCLEMFAFNLFKNRAFIFISFYNFFLCIGYGIPYLYIKDRAIQGNITGLCAALLTPCIGIGNMFGRVTSGLVLTLFPNLRALKLATNALTFAGVITILIGFVDNLALYFTYAVTYGFAQGSVAPLRSLIIVDYLGLDKLTNATGLLLLFSGTGVLIGAPIADELISLTGKISSAFYFSGTTLLLAVLMFLFVR